jgi:hypothetical protein
MISAVAPAMHGARLFDVGNAQQAAAIMLKGYELGLSLTASFEFIQVIQNKPTLSPRGMLALIQTSPENAGIEIVETKDDKGAPYSCSVTMKRRNGFEYTATFTMDDARRAGLIKAGGGWEMYPANMLRWRAIGFCADVVFPDLIGGMKRSDELGANISPSGDVIEGTWSVAPVQPASTPQPKAAPALDPLADLGARFGVDVVLAACDGNVPTTHEGIAALTEKLENESVEI